MQDLIEKLQTGELRLAELQSGKPVVTDGERDAPLTESQKQALLLIVEPAKSTKE
jgi:hypothetical protein